MIGVFDSGIGGLSVLKALRAELPHEDFVYYADSAHAPYGERGDEFVVGRSHCIARRLRADHSLKALVVACNTATAAAIHLLRAEHPDLPIVGVEPALKSAVAATGTGRIGVMATRGTLQSARLRALRESLAGQAEFILQPCDGLAEAIEAHDAASIASLCRLYTEAIGTFGRGPGEVDTLVLGCTHYVFAWDVLAALAGPDVRMIETGAPVARQARRVLESKGLAKPEGEGRVTFLTNGTPRMLQEAAARWLPHC